jgi:hypothetical protein
VFAHFDASDSRKSLIASVRLFTQLTDEMGVALGYEYPRVMVEEVTDYVLRTGIP